MSKNVLAFDFGASSGRAILGRFDGSKIELEEVHRFSNDPVTVNGTMYWDVLRQFFEIKQGLSKAKHMSNFDSIGIDTWGVDFGLPDKDGYLLENPIHYRDSRTQNAIADVSQIISHSELYGRTGIQQMYFNTIYQLFALKQNRPELLKHAHTALFMPDLFTYFLTASKGSEYSIASTTSLLNPWTRKWDKELMSQLDIPTDLFPAVRETGTLAGRLTSEIQEQLGLGPVPVYRVASHDTASAVVSVPALDDDFIYISSGTWSLMGIESDQPIINEQSSEMNYTNEGGYGGKIRFLKNIMGLWLIQETRRQWIREGKSLTYADMEHAALDKPAFVSLVDPDDLLFAPPGDMPNRIRQRCRDSGQPVPEDVGSVVRCIYESLALKYRKTMEGLESVRGHSYPKIHIVGGGTKDGLLSQFTANATGRQVVTGPIEATAMGNVAVQLISAGEIKDLQEARQVISQSFDTISYDPKEKAAWSEAAEKYDDLWG